MSSTRIAFVFAFVSLVLAGCGDDPRRATAPASAPSNDPTCIGDACDDDDEPPVDDDGKCEKGAVRECKVNLGEHEGVKSCFEGVQVCEKGVWGECGEET